MRQTARIDEDRRRAAASGGDWSLVVDLEDVGYEFPPAIEMGFGYGRRRRYVPERTCHVEQVKSGPLYDVWRFDCCDREYSESRTDDGATELPLLVCPFCGAMVVEAQDRRDGPLARRDRHLARRRFARWLYLMIELSSR